MKSEQKTTSTAKCMRTIRELEHRLERAKHDMLAGNKALAQSESLRQEMKTRYKKVGILKETFQNGKHQKIVFFRS